MAKTFNALDAKRHFSDLLNLVAEGHEIVITRDGQELAKLMPCEQKFRDATREALAAWKNTRRTIRLNDSGSKIKLRDLIDKGR